MNTKLKTSSDTVNDRFPKRQKKAASTRERILSVATDLFLTEGFSQTSLEKVAEKAKTTKPTVYSHFKSKKGLFDAILGRYADERLQVIDQLLQPTDDPTNDLVQFGDFFLSVVFSPEKQRWDRLAAAESIAHPEIGETFYVTGPAKLLKLLSAYLKAQTKSGSLNIEHPARAAEHLIGLLLGVDFLRMQIGKKLPGKTTLKRRCREAVAIFLASFGSNETGRTHGTDGSGD